MLKMALRLPTVAIGQRGQNNQRHSNGVSLFFAFFARRHLELALNFVRRSISEINRHLREPAVFRRLVARPARVHCPLNDIREGVTGHCCRSVAGKRLREASGAVKPLLMQLDGPRLGCGYRKGPPATVPTISGDPRSASNKPRCAMPRARNGLFATLIRGRSSSSAPTT
jgi:hypothetical protein